MENMCATGTEALRGATYAVACRAADIALAIGSGRLKDTGYGGLSPELIKRAMAHVSWKSHQNGALSPTAHLRKPVSMDTILAAPMISVPIGFLDCCGVSDGAACYIVMTPEVARALGKRDQVSISAGTESATSSWNSSYVPSTRNAAPRAYQEAGIRRPREQLNLLAVRDCG